MLMMPLAPIVRQKMALLNGKVTIVQVSQERQLNPVADEVAAILAVVRPILKGVLYALKADIAKQAGGRENLSLELLSRLYKEGDGDCGICFEYAVHEAMNRDDGRVIERVNDAVKLCKITGTQPKSILFGLERNGSLQLIDTAKEILTDESRVLAGTVGQPPKLKKHLATIAYAFKNRRTKPALPSSISGMWKADLVLGFSDADRWVGTTVKINPTQLEGAPGLRIGIIPTKHGQSDAVRLDEKKNLVLCPLHHDQDFMQTFYEGWRIVQAFMKNDAKIPKEAVLPLPVEREVARVLFQRRSFPVLDVIDALSNFSQPELLSTDDKAVGREPLQGEATVEMVIAPIPA